MSRKLIKIIFILISFLQTFHCEETSPKVSLSAPFISNALKSLFSQQKLFILHGHFNSLIPAKWADLWEGLISDPQVISNSGGLSLVKVHSNQTEFLSIQRTPKMLGEAAQVVLLLLPVGIPTLAEERILNQSLVLPLLGPPTVRNADKFIILTEGPHVKSLYQYTLVRKVKYKLILSEGDGCLNLYQFCSHCPVKENVIKVGDIDKVSHRKLQEYFPDFQCNFYGHLLKATATDKMYGNLEFAKDETGKDYAKRGIFASVLAHLSTGLNFTGEVFRSSGGGSTGTPLPNGSWVGSVGDVYNGGATFCMLCSISLSRQTVIDMCSPVTYEYVTFAIGPPKKLYTWEAIFQPYSTGLWITIIGLACFNIFLSYLFLKWHTRDGITTNWTILSTAQYLCRILIEQSDRLPSNLPKTIRIVLGFWLLFGLVGTTLYRAKMVTFMTFPEYEEIPTSFVELVATDYVIQFHYFPNIAYNSLKLSTNPVFKATFQRLVKEPDPVKCMAATLHSKSVCIMFTSVHEDTINRNMSDKFGQSRIRAAPGYAFLFTPGIVLEKMSDVMPNFKWILSNSLEMGLNTWWQRSDAMILMKQKNLWKAQMERDGQAIQYQNEGNDEDGI